jgi:hypothetical protein
VFSLLTAIVNPQAALPPSGAVHRARPETVAMGAS